MNNFKMFIEQLSMNLRWCNLECEFHLSPIKLSDRNRSLSWNRVVLLQDLIFSSISNYMDEEGKKKSLYKLYANYLLCALFPIHVMY